MKKELATGFILLVAIFLVLLLCAPFEPGNISTGNRSGSSHVIDGMTSGLNVTADMEDGTAGLENDTLQSPEKETNELFFQDIVAEAHGFGEYVLYDYEDMKIYWQGDDRNDLSLSIDTVRFADKLRIKDLFSGYDYPIYPPEGSRFMLVKVTAASVGDYLKRYTTPATSNFTVVDPSGNYSPRLLIHEGIGAVIKNNPSPDATVNQLFSISGVGEIYVGKPIFSSLNSVEGSGTMTGWIIYEIPEDFRPTTETYLQLEVGNDMAYWKLKDILVDLQVTKNYNSGKIAITYNPGAEGHLVRAIEAELVKADGSVERRYDEADDEDSYLPQTEFSFIGTSGDIDHLTVKIIRLDGEEIVKYQKEI